MMITDQTTRLTASKKNGKMNPKCSKCEKIPSQSNCLQCILNLHRFLSNDIYEDESLSVKEQLTKINQDLDNFRPILSLYFQIIEAYTDKKKQLEQMVKEEIIEDGSSNNEEEKSITTRNKIPIIGKKSDVGQKIGFFFFNPKNKKGLKLPKIHVAAVIESFCESYKPIDGKEYSSRYLLDNVNTGANKDLEEEN